MICESRTSTNPSQLERKKRLIAEKLNIQAEPKGSFEEKLEPLLTFLANPWKLWETGHITLRRTVLKLAFTDRIAYCRIEGARTPEIALPFKALGGISDQQVCYGALEGNNLEPFLARGLLEELEGWAEVLKGEPEVIHRLAVFAEAAAEEPDQSVNGLAAVPSIDEPSP